MALFPGIRLLIERLRASGVKLAVATGKSRRGLNRVLEATGLGPFFLDTQTADENPGKPDPGMLESIHAVLGVSPELTVMVGDTTHDLYMAKAWGCRGVGVAYGAMPAEMLECASPAAICRDVPSLARLLGVDLDCSGNLFQWAAFLRRSNPRATLSDALRKALEISKSDSLWRDAGAGS